MFLNHGRARVSEWSRELDLGETNPEARQALRTHGLSLADIRGRGDWEARGRGLLAAGTWHLWSGMGTGDRAGVCDLLAETHRIWSWPTAPDGEPGAYAGPRATLSDPRVIDRNLWCTTGRDGLDDLQIAAGRRNPLVDTLRLPGGGFFDIYRSDVKGTRYSVPSVCPHADPKPPVELRPDGDLLAELEGRFRDSGLVGPDESIH